MFNRDFARPINDGDDYEHAPIILPLSAAKAMLGVTDEQIAEVLAFAEV